MDFYPLNIKDVITETEDTKTIEFDIPETLRDTFAYKHGQYITLRMDADGHEIRRSYSMSSSPLENRLAITVKKVPGGRMSTWLHDHVKAGDTLDASGPAGRFYIPVDPEKRRTYYLFGAGSGITPLMSIIKTVLEGEPMSTIFLLYGSRNEDNIIFRSELDALTERYNGQLFVEYMLSQPKKESAPGGLFGIFKKTTTNWNGKIGRIDTRSVSEFLDENMAHGPENECQYFVCGPGSMADGVKAALLGRGVETKQIHAELFLNATHVPGEGVPEASASGSGDTRLVVHLKGQRIETTVPKGALVLDVLVKEKHDPPYSCTSGACSTCMAKVINGSVKMDACYALDDEEVKAGYILTCQSRPETPTLEITYDM